MEKWNWKVGLIYLVVFMGFRLLTSYWWPITGTTYVVAFGFTVLLSYITRE